MAPRFSVLLPTHNRADVLGYAIKSVLWQTEPDFEILVVGDGCTDNTADVVASFADPRIRWFDLPKAPHYGYANRNVALKQATGDFVAFVAHDDLLFPDHLSMLVAHLERCETEWCYSRSLWVRTDGTILPIAVNLTNADELQYFLTVANSIPACCVMHRRACLDAYGYWPEDAPTAADWTLWRRIIEGGRCQRFAYCRTPTALHFKANWRDGRTGFGLADASLELIEMIEWWPTELQISIPPGVPEQEAFSSAIAAGGLQWVEALRRAADNAVDRSALTALTKLIPQHAATTSKIDTLDRELKHLANEGKHQTARAQTLEREVQRLRHELSMLYKSRSWRLTEPLRVARRLAGAWRR